MDPVERALRMGGVREEAKKLEEDGGTIAGMCVCVKILVRCTALMSLDGSVALRHWLVFAREATYLTLDPT
jgi:hypothetical protein